MAEKMRSRSPEHEIVRKLTWVVLLLLLHLRLPRLLEALEMKKKNQRECNGYKRDGSCENATTVMRVPENHVKKNKLTPSIMWPVFKKLGQNQSSKCLKERGHITNI